MRGKPDPPLAPQALLVTIYGDCLAWKGRGAFVRSILRFGPSGDSVLGLAVWASKSTFSFNFHGKVCSMDAIEEVQSGCFDGNLHVSDFECSEEVQSFGGVKAL